MATGDIIRIGNKELPSFLVLQDEQGRTDYGLLPAEETRRFGIPIFYKSNNANKGAMYNPLSTEPKMPTILNFNNVYTTTNNEFIVMLSTSGSTARIIAFKINSDRTTTMVLNQALTLGRASNYNVVTMIDKRNVLHVLAPGSMTSNSEYFYVQLPSVLTTVTWTKVTITMLNGDSTISGEVTAFRDLDSDIFKIGAYYSYSSSYDGYLFEIDMAQKTCKNSKKTTAQNSSDIILFSAFKNQYGVIGIKNISGSLWLTDKNNIVDIETMTLKLNVDDYLGRGRWVFNTITFNGNIYMIAQATGKIFINGWKYNSANNTISLKPLIAFDFMNINSDYGQCCIFQHKGEIFVTASPGSYSGGNSYNNNIITCNITEKIKEAEVLNV